MPSKLVICGIYFLLSLISVKAGQLAVLHYPFSIRFKEGSSLQESILKDVFSASLGLSTDDYSYWDGLDVMNPFEPPEAVVMLYVDGTVDLGDFEGEAKLFTVVVDEMESNIFEDMKYKIGQRDTKESKLINWRLSEPSDLSSYSELFGINTAPKLQKQTLNFLKYAIEEDYLFLTEVETLRAITNAVNTNYLKMDNYNDFFSFKVQSLRALSTFHGINSLQVAEAKKILCEQLKDLNKAFAKAYYGNIVVTAVSTDRVRSRNIRRAGPQDDPPDEPPPAETEDKPETPEEKPETPEKPPDTPEAPPDTPEAPPEKPPETPDKPPEHSSKPSGDVGGDDFVIIFNIVMGVCLTLSFSMLTIVYAVMDMDPGRDSVIYRMTTMRVKKDL